MKKDALILLFLLIFIQILSAQTADASNMLGGKWFYAFGDSSKSTWQQTTSPLIKRSRTDPEILYLKTRFPDTTINNPALYIDEALIYFEVYYKSSLLFSSGRLDKANQIFQKSWYLINLPADFSKQEIIFKIRSDESMIGLSGSVFVDSAENVIQNILKQDLIKFFCGIFLILFAFTAFFLALYSRQYAYTAFCGFILLIGVWIIANQHLSQIYFNHPAILYYLDVPSLIMAISCFFIFLQQIVIDKYRVIAAVLWNIFLLVGIFSIILDFSTPLKISDNMLFYDLLLFSAAIATIYIIFKKPFPDKSKSKLFVTGIICCAGLGVIETLVHLLKLNPTIFGLNFSFASIGTVLLVLFWGIMLLLRYMGAYKNYIIAHDLFSKRVLDSQNEERKRIAADLHDAIGHDFLVIKTLSETGKSSPDNAITMLREISTVSEQGVNNVRSICRALYPPVLENIGLTQALKSLIKRSFHESKIELESDIEELDSYFAKDDYIHIYRIVQEIINNIIKHSAADQVAIGFFRQNEQIVLQATDNGKGIEQSIISNISLNYNSFGLSGILERVKILKGIAQITNADPSGLRIKIVFPVK